MLYHYSHCVLYLIYMCILKCLCMYFMHVNVSGRWHRRKSDWNSGGGTYSGTYYKSPRGKNTFSYIVMQVIWCLTFCNMTKSGEQSPRSKFWGDL